DNTSRFQAPSAAHWLGTTHIGEDVLSQVIHGTRGVIVVGFLAAIIATFIAITIGVIAGYLSGWKSEGLSALTNVFLMIPGPPLPITAPFRFGGPPLGSVARCQGLLARPCGARALHAQAVTQRNRPFALAPRQAPHPLRLLTAVAMPRLHQA